MNNRDRIIMEIIDAFFNDMIHLDKDTCFEIDDPEFMRNLMTLFIADKASGLSDDELLTGFSDKGQLVADWVAYLKTKFETFGKTIH